MFPLRDHQKTYNFPIITTGLIVVNVIVFLIETIFSDTEAFIFTYSLVPERVDFLALATLYPFITSQFLHAGIIHIASNLWFLRIFGDNVEDRFGHIKYLFIYLLSGVVGGFVQYMFSPNSEIPMLGASGAVAGILGAYLVFFPKHQIETLIPFGFFSRVMNLPAYLILIYWFVIQLFSGVGSVVYTQVGGGVAFWAHIGGFATGWLVAKMFKGRGRGSELEFRGYDYVN